MSELFDFGESINEPVIETDVQPKSELEKYILQLKSNGVSEEEAIIKVEEWQKQRGFNVFNDEKQKEVEKNQGVVKETKEVLLDRWGKIKKFGGEYLDSSIDQLKKIGHGDIKGAFDDSIKSINRMYGITGQVAGGIGDVLWEGLENSLQTMAPDTTKYIEEKFTEAMNTEVAQELVKSYQTWAEKNPEKAISLESAINISSIFPAGKGINIAKKGIIRKSFDKVGNIVGGVKEKTIGSVREAVVKKLSGLDSKISGVALEFTKKYPQEALDLMDGKINFNEAVNRIKKSAIEDIDSEMLKKITKKKLQPLVDVKKIEAGKLDKIGLKKAEAKTGEIVAKVEKGLEELKNKKSDIGKEYDAIAGFTIKGVKGADLSTLYKKWVNEIESKYTHLSNTTKSTLKGIKSEFDNIVEKVGNGELKYKDLKALKNNIKKVQIKEGLGSTDDAILSDFNNKLNKYLVEKIPEYKKLDESYRGAFKNIENLYNKVYDAKGNIKDNVFNIFKNLSSPQSTKVRGEIAKLLGMSEDELITISRELSEINASKYKKAVSAEEKIVGATTAKEIEAGIEKLNITKPTIVNKLLSKLKTNERLKEWYNKINDAVRADETRGGDGAFTKTIFKLIDDAEFKNESKAILTLDKIEDVIGKNELLKLKLYKSISDIVGGQRTPSFANMMFQVGAFSKISGGLLGPVYILFQKWPERALKIILKREAKIANKLKKGQPITKGELNKIVEILSKEKLAIGVGGTHNINNTEQGQEQQ